MYEIPTKHRAKKYYEYFIIQIHSDDCVWI